MASKSKQELHEAERERILEEVFSWETNEFLLKKCARYLKATGMPKSLLEALAITTAAAPGWLSRCAKREGNLELAGRVDDYIRDNPPPVDPTA